MKIGWSVFAHDRHQKGTGYSYFDGTDDVLFQMIKDNWGLRTYGAGSTDIGKVCVVPMLQKSVTGFYCPMVEIDKATDLSARVAKRREGEESHIRVTGKGPDIEAKFVKVVLYSRQALLDELEKVSGDFDWEIVSIMASPVEDEPMHPLTMARNQLGKSGGSQRQYSSDEWARSVWYWSQYVMSVS